MQNCLVTDCPINSSSLLQGKRSTRGIVLLKGNFICTGFDLDVCESVSVKFIALFGSSNYVLLFEVIIKDSQTPFRIMNFSEPSIKYTNTLAGHSSFDVSLAQRKGPWLLLDFLFFYFHKRRPHNSQPRFLFTLLQ